MNKTIEWFCINYPSLVNNLKNSNHNFSDSDVNPYHIESDCWSHTMMVCKIAELSNYYKVVQISALLHDIGKPSVRRVNPKNNHVQFFGHENRSAYMSIEILEKMLAENMISKKEFNEIFALVALHSVFHLAQEEDELIGHFSNDKSLYIHLIELNRCDSQGRFCNDSFYDTQKEAYLKSLADNMRDKYDNSSRLYQMEQKLLSNHKSFTYEKVKSLIDEFLTL